MNTLEKVKAAGVVGSGGAGFPTHVKLNAQAEWYLVNGAECEPLMHKDRELMIHFADDVVNGLALSAKSVGADKQVFGIKSKNAEAINTIKSAAKNNPMSIHEFGDYYPVGDEYELVYGITGKLIPPQGIPLHIGVVVNNVETLYNISQAEEGIPVTETFMTITGAVSNPITTRLPIGMSVKDALAFAGKITAPDYRVMESGLMMGKLITDLNQPITKTTGGLIVLPADHSLIKRYDLPIKAKHRIGHSACDQCSFCTEMCPRYLLGYDVQPHAVMRSLGFTSMGSDIWNKHSLLCCQCGLCSLYACPEALYPREACVKGMTDLRAIDKGKWEGEKELKVHPMKNARRVPLKQLMKRLGVTQYESHAGFTEVQANPARVVIPLQQHVGAAAKPVVKTGGFINKGDEIGKVGEKELGASIHASISGKITEINESHIVIERQDK